MHFIWSLFLSNKKWVEKDSNLRRRCQQIYSLSPLATRESTHKPTGGLEPSTCWLQISCSANWAMSAIFNFLYQWDLQGSNLWPSACKADALPAELRSHNIIKRPRRDSNPWPPPWQGGALTNWATRPNKKTIPSKLHMARRDSFRPPALFSFGQALGLLVAFSSTHCCASTSALSTSSSLRDLTGFCHGKTYLRVGFTLRCLQRLSLPGLATRWCIWRCSRSTSGRSIPVLSY